MHHIEARPDGTQVLTMPFSTLAILLERAVDDLPQFLSIEDYRRVGAETWTAALVTLGTGSSPTIECRRTAQDLRLSTKVFFEARLCRTIESGLVVFLSRPCPDSLIIRDHSLSQQRSILERFSPWALLAIPSTAVSDEATLTACNQLLVEQVLAHI